MDGFDGFAETFRDLGLSESAAKVAAIGRDESEAVARAQWDVSTASATAGLDVATAAVEAAGRE